MAKIIPFKAVRPTRENVSLVTARSYDDYSAAELAAQLEFNPLSFLHVLNPAYTNQISVSHEKRYRLVHQKYTDFKQEGVLKQDGKPAVYIHRIVTKEQVFLGIILGTSIEDYKTDIIKKHEDTLKYRVELFKDYIKYAGFNTEPVLMTYKDNESVQEWISDKVAVAPDFEFTTTRKHNHYLWKIDTESDIQKLQQIFDEIGVVYIADGHHRSASAEMLYDETNEPDEAKSHFLSFLIADSNVRIYEYNRLIKDLHGLTKEQFLKQLSDWFLITIKNQLFHPMQKHEFGMYMDGNYYSLLLKKDKCDFSSPLDQLDAQILYDKVLLPILGIADLRNNERIEYISGKRSVDEIKQKVDEGSFKLGFTLFPSDITEIKAIADANQIMPPKSTYIEPKFRSGLIVYEL